MFFVLSQALDVFTRPSNVLVLLGVLGLIGLMLRKRRVAAVLLCLSIGGVAVLGWLPTGVLVLRALEERFSPPEDLDDVDGIIMLGGAVDTHTTAYRQQPALNSAAERITATMALARQFPQARVLLSGGAGHGGEAERLTESEVAKAMLVAMGLPEGRITLEDLSRNTCENARRSAAVLNDDQQRWVLVTSASHMPRAVACYRAAGRQVVPYPVDFRTAALGYGGGSLSIAEGLAAADLAAHEWIGLVMYRLTGMTEELFPAPR